MRHLRHVHAGHGRPVCARLLTLLSLASLCLLAAPARAQQSPTEAPEAPAGVYDPGNPAADADGFIWKTDDQRPKTRDQRLGGEFRVQSSEFREEEEGVISEQSPVNSEQPEEGLQTTDHRPQTEQPNSRRPKTKDQRPGGEVRGQRSEVREEAEGVISEQLSVNSEQPSGNGKPEGNRSASNAPKQHTESGIRNEGIGNRESGNPLPAPRSSLPDSGSPLPDSRSPIPDSRSPIPDSRYLAGYYRGEPAGPGEAPLPRQESVASVFFQMLGGLALVAGLFLGGTALLRRFSGKTGFLGSRGRVWQVIESVSLGPKRHLYVTKFVDRLYLLGATEQQITLLGEIQDPTLATAIESGDADFRRFLVPESLNGWQKSTKNPEEEEADTAEPETGTRRPAKRAWARPAVPSSLPL